MKKILIILMVFVLMGCAALEIADIILSDPKPIIPVCGKETVGVSYQGKTCLQYTDGSYRWARNE